MNLRLGAMSAGTWSVQQKVVPSNATASLQFGRSIALEGDRLLVGTLSCSTHTTTCSTGGAGGTSGAGGMSDGGNASGGSEMPGRDGGTTRPVDTRVLIVKVELSEPVPLKLGQRVEVEVGR